MDLVPKGRYPYLTRPPDERILGMDDRETKTATDTEKPIDIGGKIRSARLACSMTQEQAAEALGVSRQTMSNWENGRTYPDIVSVIRMSDLYKVSLDHLLKEDPPMTPKTTSSDYISYLEESTNIVKSKKNLGKTILIVSFLLIWVLGQIVRWCFTDPSDIMGYDALFHFLLFPVTIFVFSLLCGIFDHFGKGKWCLPLIMGTLFMVSQFFSDELVQLSSFSFSAFRYGYFVAGLLLSLLGVGLGALIHRIKGR